MDNADYIKLKDAMVAENTGLRLEVDRLTKENAMLLQRQEEADVAGVIRHLKENKIWLLWTGSYSDKDVQGAYTTEQAANNMVTFMSTHKVGYGYEDARVEEYELDIKNPKAYHLWQADWTSNRYDNTGRLVHEQFTVDEEAVCLQDDLRWLKPVISEYEFGPSITFYQGVMHVTGMTKEATLKKLYDQVAQLKAEGIERGIEFPDKELSNTGVIVEQARRLRQTATPNMVRQTSNKNLYWG